VHRSCCGQALLGGCQNTTLDGAKDIFSLSSFAGASRVTAQPLPRQSLRRSALRPPYHQVHLRSKLSPQLSAAANCRHSCHSAGTHQIDSCGDIVHRIVSPRLLKINCFKFTRGVPVKNTSGLAPRRSFLGSTWICSMSRTRGRNPIAKKLRCGRMVGYTK
jgi:hypothetical protein